MNSWRWSEISENNSVCVASIDAKDLYTSSVSKRGEYTLRYADGSWNYKKFINTIPFSLDLIQLRDVYWRTYRNRRFSWENLGKEYTNRIINVTFRYSVKEFNRINKYTYIKLGYGFEDVAIEDHVCVINNEVVAIEVGLPVENPIDAEIIPLGFMFDGSCYVARDDFKPVMSRSDLRYYLYENGFVVDGVKYVRFKRSSGSARVGKCLFIDERMYVRMHTWDLAGLQIYKNDSIDIAAFESYISLTSSSIIDTLEIRPENILLIDDFVSKFNDDAVATYLNSDGEVETKHMRVDVCNSIWDGQSLMDTSMFGKYRNFGFLLLRNRFFKSAAFNCDIQGFFKDRGITKISQLNGKTRAKDISEIKLITTPSSIKYLKFGSFDLWLDNLNTTFGIVKHEKPTYHFDGRMVQTHYQLINTLQMTKEEVESLLRPSLEYMSYIKTTPAVFRDYIKYPDNIWLGEEPMASKNDIVYKLMGITDRFCNTRLYDEFRTSCIRAFVSDMKKGRILVNGTYATLCGNPMEMLLSSIGMFDGVTTSIAPGTIFNIRFKYGQKLLGSRSPHVTMGNVLLATNTYNKDIDRYFVKTGEIVYVNSMNENLLERLSGCDFDSDSILLTDSDILIGAAERNYKNFAVPTRLIQAVSKKTIYNADGLADLDIKTSDNKIGEIINLSQELNTRLWDMVNNGSCVSSDEVQELYCDIAFLDVLSNLEIDRAKKTLPVNNAKELSKLKKKHVLKSKDGKNIKPGFFKPVSQAKGYYNPVRNKYVKHETSMDYVQSILNSRKYLPRKKDPIIPFYEILRDTEKRNPKRRKISLQIINTAEQYRARCAFIWSGNKDMSTSEKFSLVERERCEFQAYLAGIRFDDDLLKYLLIMIERDEYRSVRSLIFYMLFSLPNKSVYAIIENNREGVSEIVEDSNGDIDIFGIRYSLYS